MLAAALEDEVEGVHAGGVISCPAGELVDDFDLERGFGEYAFEHSLRQLTGPGQGLQDNFGRRVPFPLDTVHPVLNSEQPDDFVAPRGGARIEDLAYLTAGSDRQTFSADGSSLGCKSARRPGTAMIWRCKRNSTSTRQWAAGDSERCSRTTKPTGGMAVLGDSLEVMCKAPDRLSVACADVPAVCAPLQEGVWQ